VRLLLLGGPKFLGRAVIEAALARGDEVTLFNRGQTDPAAYPEVEKLRGDRDGGLVPLAGRSWDAVVDTSGYVPRLVRASAELLRDAVERYVFVSSISVYAGFAEPVTEASPLATVEDETTEDVQEHYGALKALCERAVADVFGDRGTSIRAGLIVGPHDPTGRFTYWPHRIARGGEVLVPGHPDRPVQLVDVRDLAGFLLLVAERGPGGPVTATGPVPALTMGALADACRAVTGSDASFTHVNESFLVEHEVDEWLELPLWVAPNPGWERFLEADVSRALAAGLAFRALAETVRDTLAHAQTVDGVGLAPEREAELLRAWRGRVRHRQPHAED
jgi:2'-hydroxyisoflavone reductase